MWALLVILIVALIVLWPMISRESVSKTNSTDIDGRMVQKVLESFQSKKPDLVPINTIYVNKDGDKYKSRMLFLDGYQGVQYDITSDAQGQVLNFEKTSVSSILQGPYKPYEPDSNTSTI